MSRDRDLDPLVGVHLTRTGENAAEIDALAALLGGRVGLDTVLGDLDRQARRGWAPGRAVHRALTWDREDRRTTSWWPQGISTSADASPSGEVEGRRLLVTTWYAKGPGDPHPGSRITFLDLDTLRYRHVLLVVPGLADDGSPTLSPLAVHAGGIVWCGPWLHVAATARGFHTFRVDDLLRVPDELAGADDRIGVQGGRVSSFGYRYLLPVRLSHRAGSDELQPGLRYSCLSLDRDVAPPELVVGEYARGDMTRRLARFRLDPETLLLDGDEQGRSRPVHLAGDGVVHTQGVAVGRGRHYLSVSHGPWTPGSVYAGRPGAFHRHRWATPPGPEDLAYWPATDELWSLTEHPHRRWVFSMRRAWFDG